jgi:serine/threonine-protein kinase
MGEDRLDNLLLTWHEQQKKGRDVSAAELCRDCPELATALSQRIADLQAKNPLVPPKQPGWTTVVPVQQPAHEAASDTLREGLRSQPGASAPPSTVPGYEILKELGRGGMGVVYQARQCNLNRLVALKMILAGTHAGPDALARFLHEAETVARLKHPNIVHIYECGSHEGKPYFSLEYLEGGAWAGKLKGQPQPPGEAARAVQTLAIAVQAAHEQGIVHRDLKPANVLLAADGSLKITDFGLAKQSDSRLTATGEVMGTPSYMAPEQALGQTRKIGPAADIYALGAILYELLTGRAPFKGASAWDTLQLVIGTEPVAPCQLQPKVPRDLETICLKCLHKEPNRRYGSALDLADDLRRFQNSEPIQARPVGTIERAWRWSRRNRAVAVLAASLGVVALASIVALTGLWLRAERERDHAQKSADAERQAKENEAAERLETLAALNTEAKRRGQARAALDAMTSDVIEDWFAKQQELTESQQEYLKSALASYEEFAQDTRADEESRRGVAAAYHRVAKIQNLLGHTDEALAACRRGIELNSQLVADFPDRREYRAALGQSHYTAGTFLSHTRRLKEAESAFREAQTIFRALVHDFPRQPDYRQSLASSTQHLAHWFEMKRRTKEALVEYRDALSVQKRLATEFPERGEFRAQLADLYRSLGFLYSNDQKWKDMEAADRSALEIFESLPPDLAARANLQFYWADCCRELGRALSNQGRLPDCEPPVEQGIVILRKLCERFPGAPRYQDALAGVLAQLATARCQRDPQGAGRLLDEAKLYNQAALRTDPGHINYLATLYEIEGTRIEVLLKLKDHAGAAARGAVVEPFYHTSEAACQMARRYAACARLAKEDAQLSQQKQTELQKSYGDRALKVLGRAIQLGLDNADKLEKDKEFDAIRDREDFRKLVVDLEAAASQRSRSAK